MKAELLLVCDYASVSGGKVFINGTFHQFEVDELPYTHPYFSIAAITRLDPSEAGKHQISIWIVDDSGNVVLKPFKGEFLVEFNQTKIPARMKLSSIHKHPAPHCTSSHAPVHNLSCMYIECQADDAWVNVLN